CGGFERISKMGGKSTRIGTYKCYQCRMQFTVKVKTVFESSHVKLHIWLQAVALLSSSKKGISSNQLHRTLGVTLKTAWFMSHRLREAMRVGPVTDGRWRRRRDRRDDLWPRGNPPQGPQAHGRADNQFRAQERHPVAGG